MWSTEDQFNSTKSRTDLHKYMTFEVVKQLNPIGKMKTFTKPNCNVCMEECLTILKKLRDKHVTIVNNTLEIDIWGLLAQNNFPLILPKH